jgi:hypothetical protein
MAYERWQQERDSEIGSDPGPKQAAKPQKIKERRRVQPFTPPDYTDVVVLYSARDPVMNVSHDV